MVLGEARGARGQRRDRKRAGFGGVAAVPAGLVLPAMGRRRGRAGRRRGNRARGGDLCEPHERRLVRREVEADVPAGHLQTRIGQEKELAHGRIASFIQHPKRTTK